MENGEWRMESGEWKMETSAVASANQKLEIRNKL
jgi:hypothetical protein